jgi:hypothetical protein
MAPESMVHALEQIHALLVPGGALIDIHPNGERVEFLCPLESGEHLIGYLQESDDYIEYRQSDEAIDSVVLKGFFRVEHMGEFEFRTYADSFEELKDFLDENWSDAVIGEEVIERAKELEAVHGIGKTVLSERARIRLLVRL